jgi:hypothetical protein
VSRIISFGVRLKPSTRKRVALSQANHGLRRILDFVNTTDITDEDAVSTAVLEAIHRRGMYLLDLRERALRGPILEDQS